MASSSAIQLKKHYDVFISFRGTDTRKNFTSHLLAALKRHKIDTYIDYRLERGDEIKKSLRTAIKKSKIWVIIFSQDYASSPWCLDELAYILECKERYEGLAIPIFHEMDPSHVRHQTGAYATVFAKHKKRFEDSQVLKWRAALTKAANLSGFDSTSSNVRDDSDLVEQVVIDISKKLNCGSSRDLTGLVGIESRIQQVVQELDIIPEDCRIRSVVIWGMGGIGKTTLADAVFQRLSSQFEAACFLAHVREKSQAKGVVSPQLYGLRDKLLRKLLREEIPPMESQTIDSYYKEKLQCTKVLVVLDDVNDSVQLEILAGDQVPFGPGSRIIITTRDMQRVREMQVVRKGADHDVKIYKIEELNGDESLQFFYSNAPRESRDVYSPEFLKKVVVSAAGIPLALKIWHPLFLRCKRKEELEELWSKMKKFPNKDLHNVYRVSYDVLEENEREVFLDIVCFHNGEGVRSAKRALDACGLFADSGINILIDMSLISIKGKTLWMHDVIQEMGWEIVREQGTKEPGEQSRLYTRKAVCHVLERNTGTGRVRSIALCRVLDDSASLASQRLTGSRTNQDFLEKYKALLTDQDFIHNHNIKLTPQAFTGMHNLTFLKVEFAAIHLNDKAYLEFLPDSLRYLHWDAYPWKFLPSKFSPNNLVELSMRLSKLQRLWNKGQNPQNLTRINLRYSEELVEVPDMSKSLHIEYMDFKGCRSLVQVPSYFQNCSKLTYLNLSKCPNIRTLPEMPSKMKYLGLSGTAAEELPSSIWSLKKLARLNLSSRANIKCIRRSPRKLKSLKLLQCISKQPVRLPASIYELKSLKKLDLSGRFRIKKFPDILEVMEFLEFLRLHDKDIVEVPSSIENIVGLKALEISSCASLEFVPNSVYNLKFLEHFAVTGCLKLKRLPPVSVILCPLISVDLSDCQLLVEIPDGLTGLTSLQRLNLSGTMIQTINPTIKHASGLKYLNISNCKRLQSLPQLPCLPILVANACLTLKTVSYPMAASTQYLNQKHSFCGSINLDENTRSNMMDDARLRITRMANDDPYSGIVTLICPGTEIPKWFSCEKEGSSLKTKLPQHWFDESFLGFSLSAILPFHTARSVRIQCECNLTTNSKPLHQLFLCENHSKKARLNDERSDHLVVVYRSLPLPDIVKLATEVSFEFSAELDGQFIEVKRCGVCFLYPQGQDHDLLKFEVIDTEQATSGIGTSSESEFSESETSREYESSESETSSEFEYSESELSN